MISFRVEGLFGPIKTNSPTKHQPDTNTTGGHQNTANYTCTPSHVCTGADLTDLQFHNLQDLINQASAAIYKYYKIQLNQAINLGSVTVNGVIDQATANVLNVIALTMVIPGLMPGMTPEQIAHDAPSLISTLSAYVASMYSPPPDPTGGGTNTTSCRTCGTTTDPVTGTTTTTTVDPVTGAPTTTTTTSGTPTGTTYYVCSDGTQETDPSLCMTSAPSVVTSMTPDGSGSSSSSSGGSSTSPTTINVTPSAPDTSRVFGWPRNWVLGGFVAAGIGVSAAIIAVLSRRRR